MRRCARSPIKLTGISRSSLPMTGRGRRPRAVIESWKSRLPMPVKHVRHEHRGFRGGEIRNRGIRASTGDICIFLDGDCLAGADFVAIHRRLDEPGWFVTGNRILLSRELTEAVLAEGQAAEDVEFCRLCCASACAAASIACCRRCVCRSDRCANCTAAAGRARKPAISRSRARDLDRIDGFDCAYTGWGLEDSDLVVRLLHAGVRRKDGRFATGVLHLWHAAERPLAIARQPDQAR